MKVFTVIKAPQQANSGIGQQAFCNAVRILVQTQNGTTTAKLGVATAKKDVTYFDSRQGGGTHDARFARDLEDENKMAVMMI